MKKVIAAALSACVVSFALVGVNAQTDGIVNGDFTDGINGWTVSDASAVSVENAVLSINAPCVISQEIRVENGVYNLSAKLTNSDASQNAFLYAKSDNAITAKTAVPQYSRRPTRVTVRGIKVTDGKLNIGINVPQGGVSMRNAELTPAPYNEAEFLKGGEISKLTFVEDNGGKFRDADGNERDALQIMAENGFNLARIRVLNNPGKGRGDGTYYLPEGYQDEADCLELARRAKSKGMKIQFSFAYSDYWSDGGQQYIPAEWQAYITEHNITDKQALTDYLSEKVYDYTKKVMQDLIAQDTVPEYVSIGNEMQYGILFGHYQKSNGLYNTAGARYQVQILNAGAKAVRETSPTSRIILHTDNGGNVSARSVFYNTFLKEVDYDIIGVSYYPYYNASVSIDTVVYEFNEILKKYPDKDFMVMETGYNWNELRGDGWKGQLKGSGYYQNIYGETKEGQHAFLTELYAKLKTNVTDGRCIGDLYWDPVMLYDGGTYKIGWAIKEADDWADANVVSNSNLFDFDGRALPSQSAMKHNTDMRSDLLISGKISDTDGKPVKNKKVVITAGYRSYTAETDAYGEYIISVPYEKNIGVTADGYEGSYYLQAPEYDFILKGVDFPASAHDTIPDGSAKPLADGFTYSPTTGEINIPSLPCNGASVIAAFYDNGNLTRTVIKDASPNTKSLFVPSGDGETAKVFLWNSPSGIKPLFGTAKVFNTSKSTVQTE